MTPTHNDLVARAGRWLKNTRKCSVVFTEHVCQAVDEFPDAIGWRPGGWSIVVECKMSRADFYKDRAKPFHQAGRMMGRERWYMAPQGILTAKDTLGVGAGLLGVKGKRLIVVDHEPSPQTEPSWYRRDKRTSELSEVAHLCAHVRRQEEELDQLRRRIKNNVWTPEVDELLAEYDRIKTKLKAAGYLYSRATVAGDVGHVLRELAIAKGDA